MNTHFKNGILIFLIVSVVSMFCSCEKEPASDLPLLKDETQTLRQQSDSCAATLTISKDRYKIAIDGPCVRCVAYSMIIAGHLYEGQYNSVTETGGIVLEYPNTIDTAWIVAQSPHVCQ
jgi:hypothetical protein